MVKLGWDDIDEDHYPLESSPIGAITCDRVTKIRTGRRVVYSGNPFGGDNLLLGARKVSPSRERPLTGSA